MVKVTLGSVGNGGLKATFKLLDLRLPLPYWPAERSLLTADALCRISHKKK